ncbi:MAG: DUF5666 domain-containing protein [Candidatus Sulfotelmatobacter sp.]
MRSASSSTRQRLAISFPLIIAASLLSTGCGSNGNTPTTPQFSGNTSVTVALSSTANDEVSSLNLQFQSLTLTSQSGKTATLLSGPASASAAGSLVGAEFMHLNGAAEPLVTTSIPQDIYTSALVTLNFGEFVCIASGSVDGEQSLSMAFYSNNVPASAITVNLPSPITVTGTTMALSLDLLVSQSATIGSCLDVDGFTGYSLTPTFNLTPFSLSSSPTNAGNGKVTGMEGMIVSINSGGSGFTLSVPEGQSSTRTLPVTSDSTTVFQQGVSSFSALAAGMFVNMDGALQPDGSLLATRIAVEDPSATSVLTGPLMQVAEEAPVFLLFGRQQQGTLLTAPNGASGGYLNGGAYFNSSGTAFQVSGQLTNLQSLPFSANFNVSSMVAGQNVDVSAAANIGLPGPDYTPANTVTLIPQTIDGAVAGSSTSGNFTDYTVTLAPYDLFPALAAQPGQATLLNNPSQVEVYVDGKTQMLNTQALAAGSTLRFYGLVFNDNGTLRMDCAQVNDGVPFSAPPSSSQQAHMVKGAVEQIHRENSGSTQAITVITNQK